MEKQNKKACKFNYLNPLLKFLALIILTFLVSFLITNWRVLMLPSSERVLKKIDLSKDNVALENFTLEDDRLRMTEGSASIRINTNNNYIEKFKYTYVINNNVDVEVLLTEIDSYGNPFENTFPDRLVTDIDLSAFSIRNNVNSIELKFKGEELLIKELWIDNRITFNPYIFLAILLTGLIIFVFLFYREKLLNKVENLFLLVALTSGILFIFLLPNRLGLSWDDETHFHNIYSLAAGKRGEWTHSSSHLIETAFSNSFRVFDTPEERLESNQYLNSHHNSSGIATSEGSTVSSSFGNMLYLPMVLGFKIPNLLGLSFTTSLLLSRLTNLLLYTTIIYFAIKNIPICKRLLAFIALLPGSMFLASQFSLDALIIAFTFLGIALLIKMILSKGKISITDLITFILSMILASSPKGVYILILLFPLFLPKEKFKNKEQKNLIALSLILIILLVISSFMVPMLLDSVPSSDPRGGNVSALRQTLLLIEQPISFLKIFLENMLGNFAYKLIGIETIGHFAYVGLISPSNLFYLSLFMLTFFTFTDSYKQDEGNHISTRMKLILLVIIITIISLIWLVFYLTFTPIGSTVINGVQGRYFIPLLPLVLILLNSYQIETHLTERTYNLILLISSTFILLGSIFTMFIKDFSL